MMAEIARIAGPLTVEMIGNVERIADSAGAGGALAAALESESGEAAVWLRALLLEKAGRCGEASAALRKLWWTTEGEARAPLMLFSARLLLADGADAWYPLAEAARAANSAKLLRQVDRLLRQASKSGNPPAKRHCRLAVLSNFTVDVLAPILRAQAFGAGIALEIHLAPFNQIVQEIQQPDSKLAQFQPDAVLLAMDWRWLGFEDEEPDASGSLARRVEDIENLWKSCRERLHCFALQCNFEVPPSPAYGRLSAALAGGRGRLLRALNLELWAAAERTSGVAIVDLEETAGAFGKQNWSDPVLWQVAKQYPAAAAVPALGAEIVAVLRAVYGLTAKCVALDLDGTLWGGVIGEDGLNGIQLGGSPAGEAFVDFQKYLRAVSKSGVLLAVCSKNNEADARQPFLQHPEMVLKESDIAVFCANWQPKDDNLRAIARVVNIGTDAIVFVDDNPAERARVRQHLPEVEVIALPLEPAGYPAALARARLFEKLTLTEEDRGRTTSIQKNLERETLATSAGSVDEYLAGLGIKVELAPFDETNLPRIVQLINKTNQFNVTTRRLTNAETRALMEKGCYTQSMRVADHLGDSGLTGVLIAVPEGETLRLDTWLMSCRVLGRRLDEAMFSALVEYARRRGFARIQCEFIPTAKNSVVEDLFDRLGCQPEPSSDGRRLFSWSPEAPKPMPSVLECIDRTN